MIDKMVCLGLDKRKDMWPKLQEQVQRCLGIPLEIFVCGDGNDIILKYDHIDTNDIGIDFRYTRNKAHYNAYLCHKKIFHDAYESGVNNLLFLEDDAYLIEDRMRLLYEDKCKEVIESNRWDVIYLGWWQKRTGYLSEDREDLEDIWQRHKLFNIEEVPHPPFLQHETCGLHGILISRPILKVLANASYGPIDCFLHQNFNLLRAYFMWPKVVHTYSTWSYCENNMCNRNVI
jgi:hypothetical protein